MKAERGADDDCSSIDGDGDGVGDGKNDGDWDHAALTEATKLAPQVSLPRRFSARAAFRDRDALNSDPVGVGKILWAVECCL